MTFRAIFAFLSIVMLVACGGEEAESPPTLHPQSAVAIVATTRAPPTPTLAPGMPTAPPTSTVIPFGETAATPTPTRTPTATATPTATPLPAVRLEMGLAEIERGNLSAAAEQLGASLDNRAALSRDEHEEALYSLGVSYLGEREFVAAAATFNELLALTAGNARSETYYYLGRANAELGDHVGAIAAFEQYLSINPEMSPYISPSIAEAHLAMGDREMAVRSYELALSGLVHPPMLFDIRQRLAEFYLEEEEFAAAIEQYEILIDLAATEASRGRLTYLAGSAEILSGDADAGYQRYLEGVRNYPRAYESYLGLVALIEADIAVDEYQRGLVDFYAEAYEPAIDAFARYIATSSEAYRPDTHLYLAWSYEEQGDVEQALSQLQEYAISEPTDAALEVAELLARHGNPEAIDAFLSVATSYPDSEHAPEAAWSAAAIAERMGELERATRLYRELANVFPKHEHAPEALFRAGWLSHDRGDLDAATVDWQMAARAYPNSEYGAASLFWLLKTRASLESPAVEVTHAPYPGATPTSNELSDVATPEAVDIIEVLVASSRSDSYYALRAKDILSGVLPFEPAATLDLSEPETKARDEAEQWLRGWLGLDPAADLGSLDATLTNDPRLIVGEKLWRIGLWELAKQQLEAVRKDHTDDALLSYQLSLYFRDLGLYRSSILAASSVKNLSGHNVFEVPEFIGRLLYPVYYAEIIVPLAEQYGFDPLLQFSLVRQESLFESFARSSAVAQGLAQVIPSTGEYIAQRLNWPDYQNEDLFKPYVGLAFGAYYLDQQLAAFDEQVYAALSAYNAGPGNAIRWFERAGGDHDAFLETVDFGETRLYIERIYVGYVYYRHFYGR